MSWVLCGCSAPLGTSAQLGAIRGVAVDRDFEVPLPDVKVRILETGQETETRDAGSYYLEEVGPGAYTVLFSKAGYHLFTRSKVVVTAGRLAEAQAFMTGEYEEMDELVVRDIQSGGATEAGLFRLRMESAALMDSVGADLMSKAGVSDAAQALQLVPGTTVQDGKFAVIRGLPDRYVNAQMNGTRLPTADVDKRAVQLDQFPAAIIESVQVSKTFTPDQQGDASGGAVNVVLKGIPDKHILKGGAGVEFNTQVLEAGDHFLTSRGGGLDYRGNPNSHLDRQPPGTDWTGSVGVSRDNAPASYKWGVTAGNRATFGPHTKVGALGSFFYKRDVSHFDGGREDRYWVEGIGGPITPTTTSQKENPWFTDLYDVTRSSEEVQLGGLGAVGLEMGNHELSAFYAFTRTVEDTAVLQENTRGKHYFFPGHDPDDQNSPGHYATGDLGSSPYTRNETLEYADRETDTLQFRGEHELLLPDWRIGPLARLLNPRIDWTVAGSSSSLDSPDKRLFASRWEPGHIIPGINLPPFLVFPPLTNAPAHQVRKDAANINIGNVQRIWKEVNEKSMQYFVNGHIPFEQWTGDEGFLKFGLFEEKVKREYRQDSFSNAGRAEPASEGGWQDFWSTRFPDETHIFTTSDIDVDYNGEQNLSAWYYMIDLPLFTGLNVIGGTRYEEAGISTVNMPEEDVIWYPNGQPTDLNPGDADVDLWQRDILPLIGFEISPVDKVAFRGSYGETIARQTFKDISPIQQQEYLGSEVFIGNPSLETSGLANYDLRLDFNPYPGGVLSFSWFKKDIERPIEYDQQLFSTFIATTPVNYPKGEINGFEVEARQSLGRFWGALEGIGIGGNFTYVDSEVTLPDEVKRDLAGVGEFRSTRRMLNAPEYIYNLNATCSLNRFGTEIGLFYTVKGETLVAGAGATLDNLVPDLYEKERGTLNFTLSQKLGDHLTLTFKAKNLTDPEIETVYRSKHIENDVTRKSHNLGIDYLIEIGAVW